MRRTGRWLMVTATLWTSLGVAGPASAKESGRIPLPGDELVAGEILHTKAGEVVFDSEVSAGRARSGVPAYYAYLVPDGGWMIAEDATGRDDPRGWWAPPTTAVAVGTVRVFGGSGNWARFRVRFDVPQVESGGYSVMLCTEGCIEPLGDIYPSSVTVTQDLVAARTARELDRMQRAVWPEVRRIGKRVKGVEQAAAEAEGDLVRVIADLSRRVAAMERRAEAAERRLAELEGAAPAPAWILLGAAGAALLLLLSRRRRPQQGPPEPPRPVEMELVEPPKELEPDRPPVPAA